MYIYIYICIYHIYICISISLELLGELEELSGEHRREAESSKRARANSSPNLHKLLMRL